MCPPQARALVPLVPHFQLLQDCQAVSLGVSTTPLGQASRPLSVGTWRGHPLLKEYSALFRSVNWASSPSWLEPLPLLWAPGVEAGSTRCCVVSLFRHPTLGSKGPFLDQGVGAKTYPCNLNIKGWALVCTLGGVNPLFAAISQGSLCPLHLARARISLRLALGPTGVSASPGLRVLPVLLLGPLQRFMLPQT